MTQEKAKSSRGSVRVRGTCKEGHTTETTAPKGRVTWNGQCAHEGCELNVLARRIPRDRRPPESPAGAETPPESDEHAAREVSYDKPVPKHKQHQPQQPAEQSVPPARESAPVDELQPVIDERPEQREQPDELPHDGPANRRLVARIARRRSPERERPRRAFESPLDW